MIDVDAAKRAARRAAVAVRAQCLPEWGGELGRLLLAEDPPPDGAVVGGFWPLPGEIDIRGMLVDLVARGHVVGLPETLPPGQSLVFRRWSPDRPLRAGRFGTLVPDGDAVRPDWVLVPLLAFDRRGFRLGYGGGYYDRTLALLPAARRVGCGFAAQELDEVPAGAYDVRLDAVATERGVIVCPQRAVKDV